MPTQMDMLAPLTWERFLETWRFSLPVTLLVLVAVLGYAVAVRAARRHGYLWPCRRTAALLAAAALTVVALEGAVDVYSMALYWMHMVAHLLLVMAIPALAVLAGPWGLAERCGDRGAEVVYHALHRWPGRPLTLPGVGLVCYAAVLVGTHLTAFMHQMSMHMWLHPVEAVAYLLAGYLFLLPLLGNEPVRPRQGHLLRLAWLMLGMGVDAFVGVTLMMTSGNALSITGMQPYPWAPNPLADLHAGGAVMWVGGSGLMVTLIMLVAFTWIRDSGNRDDTGQWLTAVRRHALQVEGAADVDDDEALAEYNRRLDRLNRHHGELSPGPPRRALN